MILATYNLHLCQDQKLLIDNIKTLIASENVDIFCFQEVVRNRKQNFFISELLNHLGKKWKSVYHVGTDPSWYSIGNAIVWNSQNLVHQTSKNIELPSNSGSTLSESIFSRLIAGDTYEFKRRSLISEFMSNSTTIQIANIHLDNIGGANHRSTQLKFVLESLNKQIPFTVICGDFNTFDLRNTRAEFINLQNTLGNSYQDVTQDSGWTADLNRVNIHNANKVFASIIKQFNIHLRRKLDYVWVKNGYALNYKKLDLPGSDHLPLIVSLEKYA